MILPKLSTLLFLPLVWCQTVTPYLSFQGQTLANHSYVDLSLVGRKGDNHNSLQCHSELQNCCFASQGYLFGSWYFPSGNRLNFYKKSYGLYQDREAQKVRLHRRNRAISPTGIYSCAIAYNADEPRARETLYVGLYISGGIYYNYTSLHGINIIILS